jgi:hypothetical protein
LQPSGGSTVIPAGRAALVADLAAEAGATAVVVCDRGGEYQGRTVIPAEWVAASTHAHADTAAARRTGTCGG